MIGLTLETRPDVIDLDEIARLRSYGCTRLQVGAAAGTAGEGTSGSVLIHLAVVVFTQQHAMMYVQGRGYGVVVLCYSVSPKRVQG